MPRQSDQTKQVLEILNARAAYPDIGAWFDRILGAMPSGSELSPETLRALESHLRGGFGTEYLKIGNDSVEHLRFWKTLAEEFLDVPKLRAIYADTLLLGGRISEAMPEFLAAFAKQPTLLYEFGGELYDYMHSTGGRTWLAYKLITIRAAMADSKVNYEYIRQQLDDSRREFSDDPEAMHEIAKLAYLASRQ